MSFSLGSLHWEIAQPLVWLAGGVLLLSLAATLWRITSRLFSRNRMRWVATLLLNLAAYTGLALLLAPPAGPAKPALEVVLLSEGADEKDVHALDDVFVAPDAGIWLESPASYLLDTGQIPLQRPALDRLVVRGHGLDAGQWRAVPDGITVRFEAGVLNGLAEIHWPRQLTLGETLTVSGRYIGSGERPARLQLLDPAGMIADETRVRAGQDFSLSTRPRAPGPLEYTLILEQENARVSSDVVAVSVSPGRGARLLVIQSAPSFETRHLKNWAADQGNPLLVLSQISRDRFISQAVNLPADTDTRLSPALLAAQDIAVIDGRAWVNMAPGQRGWFQEAVENGLGLLILADQDLAAAMPLDGDELLEDYSIRPAVRDEALTVPRWPGAVQGPGLPAAPFAIEALHSERLVTDELGQALSLVVAVGKGRVALSILRERYRWLTAGEREAYSGYWAYLMEKIGRGRGAPYLMPETSSELDTVARKMQICAVGDGPALELDLQGPETNLALALAADRLGSARICAPFWPPAAGWYQLRLLSTENGALLDSQSRYVFEPNQWLNHRRQQRQLASLQRVAENPSQQTPGEVRKYRTPIEPFWPWLLLITAASLLWLERRLPD